MECKDFSAFVKEEVMPYQLRLKNFDDPFELSLIIGMLQDDSSFNLRCPIDSEIHDLHKLYKTLFTNLKNVADKENLLKKLYQSNGMNLLDDINSMPLRADTIEGRSLIARFSKIIINTNALCKLFAETTDYLLRLRTVNPLSILEYYSKSKIGDRKFCSAICECSSSMREYMIGSVTALSGIIEKILSIMHLIDLRGAYMFNEYKKKLCEEKANNDGMFISEIGKIRDKVMDNLFKEETSPSEIAQAFNELNANLK